MPELSIAPPAGEAVLRPTARCVVAVRPEGTQFAGDGCTPPLSRAAIAATQFVDDTQVIPRFDKGGAEATAAPA